MSQPQEILSEDEIYIGRQPIFDADLNVTAYELLYRNSEQNYAQITNHEAATSQVIINAFMEIGIHSLVGEHLAFINLPQEYVMGEATSSLPPERVVLEILENVSADTQVINSINNLKKQGFTIALDDYAYQADEKLLALADIIKVDLMAIDKDDLKSQLAPLQGLGKILLAEKVETHEDLLMCKSLGFRYFQGYFFSRPEIVKGATLPPKHLALMQLLAKIFDPAVTFDELESIISQDVMLSFKLLRVINSAAYSLPKKVESIKQALSILGVRNIRNWVSMIACTGVEGKPAELFCVAIVRAKMCELLAQKTGLQNTDAFFTVGMFSTLNALMDCALKDLLEEMPLSEEVSSALLMYDGDLGEALECVIAYERGEWGQAYFKDLMAHDIRENYLQAIQWEQELNNQLSAVA